MRRQIDDMTPAQQAYHLSFNRTHWLRRTYFPTEDHVFNQRTMENVVKITDHFLKHVDRDPRALP